MIHFHCSSNLSSGCANYIDGRYVFAAKPCLRIAFFRQARKLHSTILTRVTSQLQPDDYHALASFRYALRKFLSFSRRILAEEAQLTPEQYEALLALKAFSGETGLNLSDLSERLQVKPHTAVSLVDKLEELQFVRRGKGSADRRQVFVSLTPVGSSVLEKVAVLHRREIRIRTPEMIDALLRLQK
jgi:DNA-binding MarR family transcriptional regulator